MEIFQKKSKFFTQDILNPTNFYVKSMFYKDNPLLILGSLFFIEMYNPSFYSGNYSEWMWCNKC